MDTTNFNLQQEIKKSYEVEQELRNQLNSEIEREALLKETCLSIANSL